MDRQFTGPLALWAGFIAIATAALAQFLFAGSPPLQAASIIAGCGLVVLAAARLAGEAVARPLHELVDSLERRDGGIGPVEGAPGVSGAVERARAAAGKLADRMMASRNRAAAMARLMRDALVTIDRNGRIVRLNAAAEQLFECPFERVRGKAVDLLLPDFLPGTMHATLGKRAGGAAFEARVTGANAADVTFLRVDAVGERVARAGNPSYAGRDRRKGAAGGGDGSARDRRVNPWPAGPPEPSPTAGRVLVVDDNPVNLRLAELVLRRAGVLAEYAETAEDALFIFRTADIRLVLLDYFMPNTDGAAVTRAMREIEKIGGRARVPVYGWTAEESADLRQQCLAAGMDGLVAKPLQGAQLASLFERHGMRRRERASDPAGAR